jgi:hypothetical protein
MKDWWMRFGCFLTGYNYGIVRNSSEVAAKSVKRYTSAMLIVCILWSFIGFSFTKRYLHGELWGSIAGAVVLVIIIVQIERQIILSINPSKWLFISRGVIAGMMAIIGAIIIDQIVFKEDIDLEKITFIQARVDKALPKRTEEIRNQIAALDTAIDKKELEQASLNAEIQRSPTIVVFSTSPATQSETITIKDSINTTTTNKSKPVLITTSSNIPNPSIERLAPLQEDIKSLRNDRKEKEAMLLKIRTILEDEIGSKVGFLDELEIMYEILARSKVALMVWLIWLFFLLGLEMLVLISKINEKENDYEKTVKHHMDLQIRKLEAFARAAEGG